MVEADARAKMRTAGAGLVAVLHNGRLYIVNDNEERSFIAAFDARTGDELWRPTRARHQLVDAVRVAERAAD